MSTRLTKDIREAITKAVMVHRFSASVSELYAEKGQFAHSVYEDVFDKKTRELIDSLPPGFLPEVNCLGVRFGATGFSYENVYFDGHLKSDLRNACSAPPKSETKRRVPRNKENGCAKSYEAGNRLSSKYEKLKAKEETLLEQVKTAKRSVEAALSAVTTVKRLIETWPEIAPFASKYETEKPQLPALPTQHLNSILELPVDEAVAA